MIMITHKQKCRLKIKYFYDKAKVNIKKIKENFTLCNF